MGDTSQQMNYGQQMNASSDWDSWTNKAKKMGDSIWSMFSVKSNVPPPTTTPPTTTPPTPGYGGKRTKGRRRKGGNTIATNAAPVHGLQVAKPTYWIKGGKRTIKRKSKKIRKSKGRSRSNRK